MFDRIGGMVGFLYSGGNTLTHYHDAAVYERAKQNVTQQSTWYFCLQGVRTGREQGLSATNIIGILLSI